MQIPSSLCTRGGHGIDISSTLMQTFAAFGYVDRGNGWPIRFPLLSQSSDEALFSECRVNISLRPVKLMLYYISIWLANSTAHHEADAPDKGIFIFQL